MPTSKSVVRAKEIIEKMRAAIDQAAPLPDRNKRALQKGLRKLEKIVETMRGDNDTTPVPATLNDEHKAVPPAPGKVTVIRPNEKVLAAITLLQPCRADAIAQQCQLPLPETRRILAELFAKRRVQGRVMTEKGVLYSLPLPPAHRP